MMRSVYKKYIEKWKIYAYKYQRKIGEFNVYIETNYQQEGIRTENKRKYERQRRSEYTIYYILMKFVIAFSRILPNIFWFVLFCDTPGNFN